MSQSNVEVPPAPAAAPATAAPQAAPPAPAATAATPPSSPASPVATAPAAPTGQLPPAEEPNWFKPRVEQAKRSGANEVLGKLGVKDAEEAKALIDKAKAAEEAAKTELQKAQEKAKALEAQAARASDLEKTVKARADVELAALTEAQKAAVVAVAGDDPARTLSTIDALKPTWVTAPATAVAPAPMATAQPALPAATPTPVAPATTSPPPNAPGGSPIASPPDRKAEYAALKAKNPHAAAVYLNTYEHEIYPRS